MDDTAAQEEPREDSKPFSSILFVCAAVAAALAGLTVVVLLIIPSSPHVALPASDLGEPLPETPVVIEVTREGRATLKGRHAEGLQWPVFYHGGWDWLKNSGLWRSHFEPDMESRAGKGLYGTGVPVLFTLDKDLPFAVPPPDVFTNIWVRTERSDSSLMAGLSFCMTDPNDDIDEDSSRIFVFWRGKRFEVPLEHGCLPLTILSDGRYRIRHDIGAIWLPRTGATDERYRVLMVRMNELPALPYSEVALTNLIDSAGKGMLLCVDVEEGATVRRVIDFISLCRKLDQPWTFYYYAASFE